MLIKVTDFKVVHFEHIVGTGRTKKPEIVILLYANCEDGIIREFSAGQWRAFPIEIPATNDNAIL